MEEKERAETMLFIATVFCLNQYLVESHFTKSSICVVEFLNSLFWYLYDMINRFFYVIVLVVSEHTVVLIHKWNCFLQGKVSCEVYVNVNNQKISHQDCHRKVTCFFWTNVITVPIRIYLDWWTWSSWRKLNLSRGQMFNSD